MFLLENADQTGPTTKVQAGFYAFAVWGDLGTSTATLQRRLDPGEKWLSVGDAAAFDDEGQMGVDLPAGLYRVLIEGSDASGVYATLEKIS